MEGKSDLSCEEESRFKRWGIPDNLSEEEAQDIINRIFLDSPPKTGS